MSAVAGCFVFAAVFDSTTARHREIERERIEASSGPGSDVAR